MSRAHGWTPIGVLVIAFVIAIASGGTALGALLSASILAGVVRATDSLVPRAPLSWLGGVVLLSLAPPFRELSDPGVSALVAASGTVAAFAAALAHARAPSTRSAVLALALIGIVAGAAPWLGVALGGLVVAWLARAGASRRLVAAGAVVTATVAALQVIVSGSGLEMTPSATAMIAALGPGPAAVLLGAGLLGALFGVTTHLPHARPLAVAILIAAVHAIAIQPAPTVFLALLAIGVAIIPAAVRRLVPELPAVPVVLAATVPLIGVALLTAS